MIEKDTLDINELLELAKGEYSEEEKKIHKQDSIDTFIEHYKIRQGISKVPVNYVFLLYKRYMNQNGVSRLKFLTKLKRTYKTYRNRYCFYYLLDASSFDTSIIETYDIYNGLRKERYNRNSIKWQTERRLKAERKQRIRDLYLKRRLEKQVNELKHPILDLIQESPVKSDKNT